MSDDHGVDTLEPFYVPLDGPDGARFRATASTAGPWFPNAQHVGPPTALLARAVELCVPRPGTQVTRVTIEILGPVPTGEVEVTAAVLRPGRAVELVGAEMRAGGRAVLSARAWRIATGETGEVAGPVAPQPPPPDGVPSRAAHAEGWLPGYLDAVEWRWVRGAWDEPGDATVWARLRVPVVEGEEPSPLQRMAAVADNGNGASSRLDINGWLFVNTDLTVHVHRQPTGEWFCLEAHTDIGPSGAGTATSRLFDRDGHVGLATQALVVRPR